MLCHVQFISFELWRTRYHIYIAYVIMKNRDFLQVCYTWTPHLRKLGTNLINRNGVDKRYRQTSSYRSGRIRSGCRWAGIDNEWDTGEQINVGVTWLGKWKSVYRCDSKRFGVSDAAWLWLTDPVIYRERHLCLQLSSLVLFVCMSTSIWLWLLSLCKKMMWEMEKHVGGQILNRIDEAKGYLAANWMCSSAVAAFIIWCVVLLSWT